MSGCQVIPAALADIPPGPRLAHVLSEIDLARLSGFDCVEVLKAQYRQVNHERARLLAAMVEVGLCGVGPDPDEELRRMRIPDEFSADEVRAALVLTRRAANAQFWLAHDLLTRLPAVHAAMDAGVLDEPRARVLSEWTTELHPETARAVCAELLPRAPELTTGQLIEQIKKLAIALDPDWARRRYEQALAERKVVGHRNPDGSANLSGCNLPVDRVAAACGRIDALAKAAKHAGDPRPIDHIRADLFLGMTDGTYAGLDDKAILNHLRTTHGNEGEPDDTGTDGDDGQGPKDDTGPDGGGAAVGDCCTPDDLAQRGPADTGMELRVRLSTLLGCDEYPAELAGWGPVHAELARDLATSLGGAQWRFAITDEHGQRRARAAQPLRNHPSPSHRHTHPDSQLPRHRGTAGPCDHPARSRQRPRRAAQLGAGSHRPHPPAHQRSDPMPRTALDDSPAPRCADTSRSATGTASWLAAAPPLTVPTPTTLSTTPAAEPRPSTISATSAATTTA
ncbi:MAG: DUF222 domain-containing protein [Pseudonocardiales bacterium]|nr:DUF222 domain-containing protein [Pseudonocardiales bacterium]